VNELSTYSLPKYYDIAFDFREMDKETQFINDLCERHLGRTMEAVVELGCGPAYHAIHLSKEKGICRSIGIDNSPEMVEYAQEKNRRESGCAEIVKGDMRDFKLDQPVDVALCMLATFHLLLSNDDMISCLRSTASNLKPGGLFIIECSHPSDIFAKEQTTENKWTMERDGISVTTRWGDPDDPKDSITQIDQVSIGIKVDESGEHKEFEIVEPTRMLTYQEMMLLVEVSGVFRLVDVFGANDVNQPFDNQKGSWRMTAVLKKNDD
jgi:SAM-dependent methyltransferase